MATKKKRVADSYLTHDNWDVEENEEPQDPGIFTSADDGVLAQRVIRKAKRRAGDKETSTGSGEEKTNSNPFAAFGGFGGKSTNLTFGSSSFSAAPKPQPTKTSESSVASGFWKTNETEKKDFFANRGTSDGTKNSNTTEKVTLFGSTSIGSSDNQNSIFGDKNNNATSDKMSGEDDEYFQQLCALNVSVMNWIKTHVESNPCIDLQPVFRDYEKHMKGLETKYKQKEQTPVSASSADSTKNTSVFKTPEGSLNQSLIGTQPATRDTPSSSFSTLKSSTPIPTSSIFGDVKTSNNQLFNSQSPFSFKPTTNIPATVQEETNGEAAEETNPEPERKTIVEKDSFHQIRCKLFFKKGEEWKELGLGMLYLKPSTSDGKVQLLVRMETTTGKVLLNVTIDKQSTPVKRSGKNNVMVVTIPNPPVYAKETDGDNSKPCTYLIRVKGTTEADELREKIVK